VRHAIATCLIVALAVPRPAAAQDPASIAAAGQQIYDYLQQQKKEDSLKQIESRLKGIETQLQAIRDTVERIATILSRLEVAINELPETEARVNAFSQIGVITDSIDRWIRERGKRSTQQEVRRELTELQRNANNLMQRRSWPNYTAVAMCMLVERDLMVFLKEAQPDRAKRFERYRAYFHEAQDVAMAGSIAQRHAAFVQLAVDVNALLAQQPQHPTCFVGKSWLGKEGDRRQTCKYHIHQYVIGNVRDGYCFVDRSQLQNEHQCYSEPREHPGGERPDRHGRSEWRSGLIQLVRMPVDAPQPLQGCVARYTWPREVHPLSPAIGTDPNSWCPEALNVKRQEYLTHVNNADTLKAALDTAAKFEQQAERLKKVG
jgi:hypothetical protein